MSASLLTGGFGVVLPWRRARLVRQMAGEIARECRGSLGRRVGRHVGDMSLAELRGYTRALASYCVDGEIAYLFQERRLGRALRSQVAESAINQLVMMIAHDVLSGEVQTSPQLAAA